jgi:hypothetical protein
MLLQPTRLSLGAAEQPAAVDSAADVFRKASTAVVTIITANGQGSGVIVDPSGVFVTNLHVLRGEAAASVKLSNGDLYDSVTILDVDERKDIVVGRIRGFNLNAAQLGDSDRLQVGERVFAIGTPKGMELTISEGIVSAVRDSGDGYRVVQTTAAISPGSSGGGLFDAQARLVAITSFKIVGGEALNFALPVNYARGMLNSQNPMSLPEFALKFAAEPQQPKNSVGTEAKSDAAPRLAGGYTNGAALAMFEPRPDGSVYVTFSLIGVVYGSATLTWDKAKGAYVGNGTMMTVCGEFDTRIWDAPIQQEIYVISSGFIRDRWTQPTRVNCSRGQVTQFVWEEAIWYVQR